MVFSRITTGAGIDVALATEGNDLLLFDGLPVDQRNLLSNSPGKDVVLFLAGNDLVSDNSEGRTYFGMGGDDTLCGNQGSDTLVGGQNADSLIGGKGQDFLAGDFGNDVMFGDADNDILNGGAGSDTFTGGQGSDLFILSNAEGVDRITDFQNGVDFIQLPQGVNFSDLIITTNSGKVAIVNKLTNQLLVTLDGITVNDLTTADFITGTSSETPDPFGERLATEYKAFLSPEQEPGEETNSQARGVGTLSFARNLGYGEVELQMSGVDPAEITGIHIHCGPPGVLGPIVLNLGQYGDFKQTIVDGKFSARFTNENITFIRSAPDLSSSSLPVLSDSNSHIHEDGSVHSHSTREATQLPGTPPPLPGSNPQLPNGNLTSVSGDTPPLPTGSNTPPLPTGSNTPPLPTGSNTPPLPTGSNTPPLPTGSNTPPLPTGSNTPSLPAGSNTPPLPAGVPQIPDEGLAQVADNLPRLPEGCPVEIGLPGQVNTVAGVEAVARRGGLYFNVHTEEHNFYGEMRGQIYPANQN